MLPGIMAEIARGRSYRNMQASFECSLRGTNHSVSNAVRIVTSIVWT